MNPYMSIKHKTIGKFRVGDKVRIPHGWGGIIGTITEDFGNIGAGQRRLYDVKVPLEDEPEITLGDDDMELVERPTPNGKPNGQ
jgi:hypothetical protein